MLRIGEVSRCGMASIAKHTPKEPLVVIVGATGTGKSKLAVDLASKFNGEIINADAVQMYRGLPIVTNKIPEIERNGIKHHLLDFISLNENPWTVHEFVRESSKIIEKIRGQGKLPIVVGGTSYYVQSLLFKESILANSGDSESDNDTTGHKKDLTVDFSILDAPTERIYAKLFEVDPEMAQTWHPNDRRKIQRSLEIWLNSGRKPSEVYAEQKIQLNSSANHKPHFPNRYDPLVFWLDTADTELKSRLNSRVNTMVEQGLLDEVMHMRQTEEDTKAAGLKLDQTRGIWVAIGYKEFAPWLDALQSHGKHEGARTVQIAHLKSPCIGNTQNATRQYAKRQTRWIRLRLANAMREAAILDRLFLLDGTDVQACESTITGPSQKIAESFLRGQQLPSNRSLSNLAAKRFEQIDAQEGAVRKAHPCQVCNKTLMSEQELSRHLQSSAHKKVLASKRKRAQREAYLRKPSKSD